MKAPSKLGPVGPASSVDPIIQIVRFSFLQGARTERKGAIKVSRYIYITSLSLSLSLSLSRSFSLWSWLLTLLTTHSKTLASWAILTLRPRNHVVMLQHCRRSDIPRWSLRLGAFNLLFFRANLIFIVRVLFFLVWQECALLSIFGDLLFSMNQDKQKINVVVEFIELNLYSEVVELGYGDSSSVSWE